MNSVPYLGPFDAAYEPRRCNARRAINLATSLEIIHTISEGAEVPVRHWRIGPANTEAKAYEAFAEYAEPRLDVRADPDRFQVCKGLSSRSLR